MSNNTQLGPWIRRFLTDYLPVERNLSTNTQKSYRDTLQQLLPFAARRSRRRIDRLEVSNLSHACVLAFLKHVEEHRHCSVSTRNQRLAAIHSLGRFIATRCPESLEWYAELKTIPVKKGPRPAISYLEKDEMDAILAAPDVGTAQGLRDFSVLLFLYNSGARAEELARLRLNQLSLSTDRQSLVTFHGKGNKERRCPLWARTVITLQPLIESRSGTEPVFINRLGQPYTRFGINGLVKRNAAIAAGSQPSLEKK